MLRSQIPTVLGLLLFAFFQNVESDIQKSVDMVTKVSNRLIATVFKDLCDKKENVILGPFGLATNLAMLMEASQGKTRQEVQQVLNVYPEDTDDLRRGFRAYCDLFLGLSAHVEAAGTFNMATLSSPLRLQPAYHNILAKTYCVNITEEEGDAFSLGSDSGVMSHWKDYEKLAVYTFLSHQAVMPFTRADGTTVQVPMVPQVGLFRSVRWGSSQAILLPLEAKLVHLLILVPDTPQDAAVALSRLANDTLVQLIQTMPRHELEVFLPQTTIINKAVSMAAVLHRRGLQLAFDPKKADLSRAFDKGSRMFVRSIQQDAYFSTSFVALNSVAGMSTSVGSRSRAKRDATKLYVDKPFLFFVLHRDTQLVLLAGKIDDPIQVPS